MQTKANNSDIKFTFCVLAAAGSLFVADVVASAIGNYKREQNNTPAALKISPTLTQFR